MTTKPKTKRFRIRRAGPAAEAVRAAQQAGEQDAGPQQAQQKGEPAADAPAAVRPDQEIDSIRREGLTGRQLRMARRLAQKQGLAPTSDFDAVRLLRAKGIDPFQRANTLELVVRNPNADASKPDEQKAMLPVDPAQADGAQLPQTQTPGVNLPSTERLSPAARRAAEISGIQRDIARRRRRKLLMLMARLTAFVFLPTLLAGYYYTQIATPMYATKSEFLILQADGQAGSGGIGGLLSGTQFATNQDAIAVQSYLQSRDAMLRLDGDLGFKDQFRDESVDPIQRLDPDSSVDDAYSIYQRNVKIGYDPTEGVIRMEVIAPSPEKSEGMSQALIRYAEERVDNLTQRKREDQMADALASFETAEANRRTAQQQLVRLQQEGAILDPEARIASLRTQINNFEIQIQEKRLQLAALLDNPRPNQSRVEGVEGDIRRLEVLLAELNVSMTEAAQGEDSLAQLSAEIQMAQADLATRDMMLQSALQQVEQTRMEANRQVRYLTTSVKPVAPDEPTYPRAFENTVLAFLVFSGIYLMVSLTASILREQVSS